MASLTEVMENFQLRLGERVKARRKTAKLGQKELAFAVGYESHTMISEIENGKELPSMQKVIALAYTLGCTVEELIGGDVPEGVLRTEPGSFSLSPSDMFDATASAALRLPAFARKECANLLRIFAEEIEGLPVTETP